MHWKYTNGPVVSFFCRFILLICRDDFRSFKTFQKNTNGETIIVISYNWSRNFTNFTNFTLFCCLTFFIFLRTISFVASLKLKVFSSRPFIYFSISVMLEWLLYFLIIANRFPVSKWLFLLETTRLLPNLRKISPKYLLKVSNFRSNYLSGIYYFGHITWWRMR